MLASSRSKGADRTMGETGWSERRGLVLTPRRDSVSPESRAAAKRDAPSSVYARPSPFADPRAMYRVPHDHLVTDVFTQWQDGGADPD